MEIRPRSDRPIGPADWEAQAAGLESTTADAVAAFRFLDDAGRSWSYNGTTWSAFDGSNWAPGTPPEVLHFQPFTLDARLVQDETPPASAPPQTIAAPAAPPLAAPPPAASAPLAPPPAPAAMAPLAPPPAAMSPAAPSPSAPPPAPVAAPRSAPPPTAASMYRPSHIIPVGGLPTWSRPDATLAAGPRLDPGLDVMLAESFPNGWARITCSNQWTAWVDGRLLVPATGSVQPGAPVPPQPAAATPAASTALGGQLRNEIGVAALLGVAAWFIGAFGSIDLLLAVYEAPWAVGLGIGVLLLVTRALLHRKAPGVRELGFVAVDIVVVTIVLWAFTEL